MGTRIIYILVFGIVLLLGSVFALTSLTSHSYIEKVGDNYEVWEKVNSFSVDSLSQKKSTIINEINQLENKNPSLKDFKDYCGDYCSLGGEQDNNDYCIPDCMSMELDNFYQNKNTILKDYEKELNWIKSIK